jgi:hypothetical protein
MISISRGLYAFADISMIKSGVMMWVCGTGRQKNACTVFMKNLEINNHLEDLD